jgi:hypothetical protein
LQVGGPEREDPLPAPRSRKPIASHRNAAAQLALRPLSQPSRERAATCGYYAMGTIGMYWFFERVTAFA